MGYIELRIIVKLSYHKVGETQPLAKSGVPLRSGPTIRNLTVAQQPQASKTKGFHSKNKFVANQSLRFVIHIARPRTQLKQI